MSHSSSPAIHDHLLTRAGIAGSYERRRTTPADLPGVLDQMRDGVWDGLNTTMPLKGHAAALVDELAGPARQAESVNTLAVDGEILVGHSTDAVAANELMRSERFVDASAVLVLGSGGSARAVLAGLPTSISRYVSARDSEKAASVAGDGQVVRWGVAVAGAVVINCTPLGMAGEYLPDPVLRAASGLIDLPYGSGETPAVAVARARGLAVADGREFLVRQALAAFALWTGERFDYESVSVALKNV